MSDWNNLGVVAPKFSDWQAFLGVSVGVEVFRISFLGDLRVNSYARIRSLYVSGEVSPSVILWPKEEQEIITLEIPQPLMQSGYITRYLQIRKFWTRRSPYRRDSAWSIMLEESAIPPNNS